jgi:branched-chain amino acid transport system ATP-binding protein
MTALLDIRGVTKRFRGLTAVDAVSFSVDEGEIFAVIGPNGAGKTTLFNLIAGVMRPDAGEIRFAGERSDGVAPHELCRRGLARTFQIVRPFPELTVMENATIGAMMRAADMDAARAHAGEVLRRLDLFDRRNAKAKSLTLPDRKRLECARALATEPRLLLLDEVMAGLRPTEVDRIVAILKEINRQGVTIILIEHVMRAVMALAGRIHVLHHGATIAEGAPDEVTRHPKVLESYLGAEAL